MRFASLVLVSTLALSFGCQNEELEMHNRMLMERALQLESENDELEVRAASCEQRLAEAQRGLSIPIFGDGSEEGPMVAMNIAIAEDGSLFLDGQPVELDAIASRAAELGERGRAVIAADGRARHARVVEVITTVRENGVERHALSVRALEEQ